MSRRSLDAAQLNPGAPTKAHWRRQSNARQSSRRMVEFPGFHFISSGLRLLEGEHFGVSYATVSRAVKRAEARE